LKGVAEVKEDSEVDREEAMFEINDVTHFNIKSFSTSQRAVGLLRVETI
jgi:hypothetical protein